MKWKKSDIKILLWPLGVIAAAALLYYFTPKIIDILGFITGLLLPFIIGYILSKLINPIADKLQNKFHIPRGLSAVLIILLVIGIVAGLIFWGANTLKTKVGLIYLQNPNFEEYFLDTYSYAIQKLSNFYNSMPKAIQDALTGMFKSSGSATGIVMDYAARFVKAMPNAFVAIIVAILSLYFMVADKKCISSVTQKIFKHQSQKSAIVWEQIRMYVGGYVKAQLIIMSITATIMSIWFLSLNIKFAILIAIGIAFLDALPIFGSGLILWPWAAMNFLNGDIKRAFLLILVYASIALTRHLIEPKLVSKSVGMNPLLTLVAMYIGYRTLSFGGLIAGPLIMLLIVSLYKGGIFDTPIALVTQIFKKTQKTLISLKDYILSDEEDNN